MFMLADLNLRPPAAYTFSSMPFSAFPSRISGATNSLTILPEDVLRQILECTARSDRRTALTLARLSRTIQSWIEEIIYAQVHLLFPHTVDLFLRTIQESPRSRTKPPGFFEHAVRSLFVCSDVEPESVLGILSVCRGVSDLSYWAAPRRQPHGLPRTYLDVPQSPFFATHLLRKESKHVPTPQTITSLRSFEVHNLCHIYPRKLSVLLHESQLIFLFRPTFGIPFFAGVTHLAIVNRWEEWTSWAGSGIGPETMPSLVYLKFDLVVGQAASDGSGKKRSQSKWLDTVTDIRPTARERDESEDVDMNEEIQCFPNHPPPNSVWTTKMEKVSSAISDVLNNHVSLKVCVLILRFDINPAGTAKIISRHLFPKFKSNPNYNPRQHPGLFVSDSQKSGFDPRLVFAWEKQPFRYSYAHSAHEGMIWKSAEAVAKAQRYLSGYTILNCDCLI